MLRLFYHLAAALLMVMVAGTADAEVDFDKLYGSDLGMGIGARAMSLGGAFVSVADDPTAVYWNPAGLTAISGLQVFLSAETIADFSAVSVVYSPKTPCLSRMDLTFGLSHIRRLRFNGDSGDGDWSGYPSHLLDLAMVNVGEDFKGTINSKTTDTRLSVAFSPPWNKKISFGFNYIFVQ
ncbi:MAG: hypothetical protein WA081_12775 [Desulfosalsimonadaceae bacterium]